MAQSSARVLRNAQRRPLSMHGPYLFGFRATLQAKTCCFSFIKVYVKYSSTVLFQYFFVMFSQHAVGSGMLGCVLPPRSETLF